MYLNAITLNIWIFRLAININWCLGITILMEYCQNVCRKFLSDYWCAFLFFASYQVWVKYIFLNFYISTMWLCNFYVIIPTTTLGNVNVWNVLKRLNIKKNIYFLSTHSIPYSNKFPIETLSSILFHFLESLYYIKCYKFSLKFIL